MQYKTIFVIFVLLFSIVLFNGCTQRNTIANESTVAQDEDLTECDIVDLTIQSLIKFYLTNPIMHNAEIKELQERLVELGFINVGEIDGYYGHRTAGEIFFIKAALNFVDYYVPELDWRPEGYSVIDEELWGIIFDPEKATLLNSISQIRLFNNDPLRHEPENNPNVTEFKEIQLPFTYPDWVPPWGMGDGRKIQREYYYNIGTNRISIIETIETAFVVSTTVRDFSFQNGLQIRQSIVMADDPITTVRFSIPQDE